MRPRPLAVLAACLVALALGPGAAAAQPGAVQGVVYDSLTQRPLAGAVVQSVRAGDLAGGRAVTADSAGRFRIDSLAPGRYLITFVHPLLDLLRVEAKAHAVDLAAGADPARVDLGVPDLSRVRPLLCGGEQAPTDSSGLLAGRVRDAADDSPVVGAKVVLTWSEVTLGASGGRGVRTERRRIPVTTGPGGRYVVCGVPAGEELVVSAAAPRRASGEVAVEVPPHGLLVRDLALGDSVATAGPKARDTTATSVARGTARLTGTVRDSGGRPVRGARALLWGTSIAASSDGDGVFTLNALPAGTHTLEVRAIGYTPRRLPVDLAAGRLGTVSVRLGRVTNLDPVTVFGTPAKPSVRLAEFIERRSHNPFGRYITGEEIELRNPIVITDVLRSMPALQIDQDSRFGNTILGRGPKGRCVATLVVDGTVLPSSEAIDRWVSPGGVAGIEVYANPADAPVQYGSRGNNCSVVLFWTK